MDAAKLARWNTALLFVIVAVNLYVVALPVLPAIDYWWRTRHDGAIVKLETAIAPATPAVPAAAVPADNRLVVPAMLLDEPIYGGTSAAALRKGIWRRPGTGTPPTGGNTVLVAHRLTYTNPRATFYNLDKVKPGDTIGVWWEGTLYRYAVEETKVVPADRIDIESPSDEPRLTLYTCTPLWLPKDRLVVVAKLLKGTAE